MSAQTRVVHFGLIADGTRRWAAIHAIPLKDAYQTAVEKIQMVSDAVFNQGTEAFSVYLLSVDNLRREPNLVNLIVDAEVHMIETILPRVAEKWQCRIVHAGNEGLLPRSYASALRSLTAATSHYRSRTMYACAAYDPTEELTDGFQRSQSTGEPLVASLWVPQKLDLVLRTGGERRMSNFLPLQSGYAELCFSDKLFPDFQYEDIEESYTAFGSRERRRGL